MVYYVRTTHNNGYYCGCCSHSWDNTESYETLEEAISKVPQIADTLDTTITRGDYVLEKIKIEDGATGQEIACWSVSPIKMQKQIYYWNIYGYRPDGPFQSIVYGDDGKRTTLTNKEAYTICRKKELENEFRDKQHKLEEAQKNFDWAKKQLEDIANEKS